MKIRKDRESTMERIKNVIGDVVVYGVCLISIAEIMNAVFDWLFYV